MIQNMMTHTTNQNRRRLKTKSKPVVDSAISLLGLPCQGEVNAAVLDCLMRTQQTDLPQQRRRGVLVSRQPLSLSPLDLGSQLIAAGHEEVDQILAID